MNTAGVAGLCPFGKTFCDAESLDFADDGRGVNEMGANGGVRKLLSLFHVNNVGGGCQKAAGLALERQILGDELPGGEHGNREAAANSDFVDGAKIHFQLPWSTVSCLR